MMNLAVLAGTILGHTALFSPTPRNSVDRFLPQFEHGQSPDTPCTCANGLPSVAPYKPPPTTDAGQGRCWRDPVEGINYNNHQHNIAREPAGSFDTCCELCTSTTGCTAVTFVSHECFLKNSTVGRTPLAGAISGGVGKMPPLPPLPPRPPHTQGCDQGLRINGGGQPCLWWSQACSIGCDKCATDAGGTIPLTGNKPHADKIGFRTRYCNSTLNATLPKHAWTMNTAATEGGTTDSYRFNPWRAPGYAPISDPCGQAGGKFKQTPVGGDSAYTQTEYAAMGDYGSKVLAPSATKAQWKAGTSQEVMWGIRYNHGGGYQYRLCPASEPLTEECMQRMPLQFDRDAGTTLVWNNGTRWPITNVYVDTGVRPVGSTWARNPIPRVNDDNIGLADLPGCPGPTGKSGPRCVQFQPPCPQDTGRLPWSTDGSGQGECSGDWTMGLIADKLIIPKTIAPGDYVLGWRQDCEETAQIWSNCADIHIAA